MRRLHWLLLLGVTTGLALGPGARAQTRPYIGFVYPAGGQQGTTVQVRLGGQGLDGLHAALVTGSGATARVVEFQRRLNNQELQLLNEQLKELKRATTAGDAATAPPMTAEPSLMMSAATPEATGSAPAKEVATSNLIARIEKRTREFVQTPACAAIATLAFVEVQLAPDAEPGRREIRLVTTRGVSNPLAFQIGQLPELTRKPMLTTPRQVLGKEAQALRKRPAGEAEERIVVPCTVNGQIGSGEVDRYRFEARRGQRLVITTQGRQLIPYIADAVPGWFQPVLALYDANGKEVAYADDYQFNPDPTVFYEVPRDGAYVFAIQDSLYRGREDFVYRITIGELPFVTSVFPLGARVGELPAIRPKGWNLQNAVLATPATNAGPGVHWLAATRQGFRSNRVPFALDTWPECVETNLKPGLAQAQTVTLPVIVNGRIEKPGEGDVFAFDGKSNALIVAEVYARRLDSPLDSVLKLTDAAGTVLAFNDDHEDLASGQYTHQADSYIMARLPADGTYYVHVGDTARNGGEDYGYRLRLSPPRPDFALRVVPSSASLRSKSTAPLTVYALRQDGFAGSIKLALKSPPKGFSASPVTLAATQTVARLTLKSDLVATEEPVNLTVVGNAKLGDREVTHDAVPAEDQMQAFLWRHLVPAGELKVLVFDPAYEPPSKRIARPRPPPPAETNAMLSASSAPTATNTPTTVRAAGETNVTVTAVAAAAAKPTFTKQQIAGRWRQLKRLFEEGLLTDEFYDAKVAECEAVQ